MINFKKVLIVVAHPDDEVLGCGGIIQLFLKKNIKFKILILGEGSSCRFNANEINSQKVKQIITQRQDFAKNSFKVLGVSDYLFNDFPCGRFDTIPIIDIGKFIEHFIDEYKPDTLITHSENDTNSDHRIVFNAVNAATRPTPTCIVQNVLTFEIPSSSEWRFIETFKPNFFVDISKFIERKIEAFECFFETEGRPFPFPRSREGLLTYAKFRGLQSGCKYSEAFRIIRSSI